MVTLQNEETTTISRKNIPNCQMLANMLFTDSDFSDVTLVSADNQHVSAHRAVLSAASSFLRSVLFESCQQNTFLYMGMIDFKVLQSLVEFIYLGHCRIDSDKEGQLKSLAVQLGVDMSDTTVDIAGSSEDNLTQDINKENSLVDSEVDKSPGKVMEDETQIHGISFGGKRDDNSKDNLLKAMSDGGWNDNNYTDNLIEQNSMQTTNDHNIIDLDLDHEVSINTLTKEGVPDKTEEMHQINKHTKYETNYSSERLNSLIVNTNNTCKSSSKQIVASTKIKFHSFRGKIPKVIKPNPTKDMKYACNECDVTPYLRWDGLKRHKLSKHEGFTYNCDMCEEKFKYHDKLKEHENFVHNGIGYQCNLCSKIFTNAKNLRFHDSRKLKCPTCGILVCRLKFVQHNTLNHDPLFKDGEFVCDHCTYTCKKRLNMKVHYGIHKERITFSCDKCSYTSISNHEVKIHKQVKHDGIKFKCTQCDYECGKRARLNRHTEVEHLKITYSCTRCKFIARRKKILREHIRSVHDNITFKCSKCEFTAVSNSSVRRHFRRDHERVRWNCDKCKFVTKFRESYKEHEKLHASGKYGEEKIEKLKRLKARHELRLSPVKKNICGKLNCCVTKNQTRPTLENQKSVLNTSFIQQPKVLHNLGSASEKSLMKDNIDIQIRSMIKQLERGYICTSCDKAILFWSHVKSHIATFHVK